MYSAGFKHCHMFNAEYCIVYCIVYKNISFINLNLKFSVTTADFLHVYTCNCFRESGQVSSTMLLMSMNGCLIMEVEVTAAPMDHSQKKGTQSG